MAAFVLFSSLRVYAQPASSNRGSDLLVSGQLIRSNTPRTYRGKAVLIKDAHAVVTLYYTRGIDWGVSEVSVTQRIKGITGFPIAFRLEGAPEKIFRFPAYGYGQGGYYYIEAEVFMGAGDKLHVGDYISETLNIVYGPTLQLTVPVIGLLPCGAPGGSVACADNYRTQ